MAVGQQFVKFAAMPLVLLLLSVSLCRGENCTAMKNDWCGEKAMCHEDACLCPEGHMHDGIGGSCIKNPSGFAVYKSLCLAGVLLLIGKFLRVTMPLFQKAFLPASIIAGLGFFIVLQIIFQTDPALHKALTHEYTHGWHNIGPFAIDVLFSSLFLGNEIPSVTAIVNKAGPQFVYNQVVNWGTFTAAGLVMCIFVYILPQIPHSEYMAPLVPAGFTGGHSFIFALSEEMSGPEINYPDGIGIGLYIATMGQIFSFILGVAWINRADAKGMLKARPSKASQSDIEESSLFAKGLFSEEAMPSAGKQTVCPDSMEVLSLHCGVIFLCLFLGVNIWQLQDSVFGQKYIQRFLFCITFGIIFQMIYAKLVEKKMLPPILDAAIMARLQGLILDFLIVTAVSTLDVKNIIPQLPVASLACAVSLVWCGICTWYLAPLMLPDNWFERAICEFGQCTGVISSGLILLKMCDPKQTLPVMDSFALKNFAAMPLMFSWLPQTLKVVRAYGLAIYTLISFVVLMVFIGIWYFIYRPMFARIHLGLPKETMEMKSSGDMEEFHPESTKRGRAENYARRTSSFL